MNSSPASDDSVIAESAAEPAAPVEGVAHPAPADPAVETAASEAAPAVGQAAPEAAPAAPPAAPEVAAWIAAAPAAAAAEAAPPVRKPAPEVKAEVKAEARRPSASLIPFIAPQRSGAAAAKAGALWRIASDRRFQVGALAAALALGAVVTAASISYGNQQAGSLEAQSAETQTIEDAVRTLKTRIGALEAARRDETADLRRTAAELKSGLTGARDANAALAQLGARLDRLEHDQDSRIEKLGERVDHDATTRNADFAARLEKIERKLATPVVVSLAPPQSAPAVPPPKPPVVAAAIGSNVSRETTGSIAPVRPLIRGWVVREVQDGMAFVEGPYGYREISPGEYLPGAGRVERIERHGSDWQVVTSLGTINSAPEGNF
ncbi:MAG: hypothetical protein ACLQJL_07105 [Roseiarcus sp.]